MATFKQFADSCLKMANGGVLNNFEPGPSRDYAMFLALTRRNFYMEADIRKTEKSKMPEDSYYSEYRKLPLQWDADQEVMFVKLPNGLPADVDNGMGIRINPVKGQGGYFVWAYRGWCDVHPEIAWAEGNYVYEFRNDRIVFTNMPKDAVREVRVEIIETGSLNPDAPLPMPSRYASLVMNDVVNLLQGKRDTQTNYKAPEAR